MSRKLRANLDFRRPGYRGDRAVVVEHLTLEDVKADEALSQEFSEFVETVGGLESILFYENIEIFETVQDAAYRNHIGRKLVALFMRPSAKYRVEMPQHVKSRFLYKADTHQDFAPDAFSQVKALLRNVIETNLIIPFQQSKEEARKHARRRSTLTRIHDAYEKILRVVREAKH